VRRQLEAVNAEAPRLHAHSLSGKELEQVLQVAAARMKSVFQMSRQQLSETALTRQISERTQIGYPAYGNYGASIIAGLNDAKYLTPLTIRLKD